MKYNNDATIQALIAYAKDDENIRAVLMEGSRAFGAADKYSDYDIVYVTQASGPYFNGAILPFLIDSFGEIAVMQTPDNGDPHDAYTHLVQFASGVRVDLTFNSVEFLSRTQLESATVILLDKDGRFADAPPPSDSDFWLKRPDAEEFSYCCNEFWWCSPYVAKAVTRGQLLHALEVFGSYVRKEYAVMLAYLAGARNDWVRVNPGKHGTNIKKLLPPNEHSYVEALLGSYVRADADEIRNALFELMRKFYTLAAAVADALGYAHNSAEAEKTIGFILERFA